MRPASGERGARRRSLTLLALVLVAGAGCATPLRPSGGPADTTPPRVEESRPAAGAVQVRDPQVVLTFSERVDEASVRRALTVSPPLSAPPDVRVRGREVHIDLGDSLRADLTYVMTLGTELHDLRGVALQAPITLAFATGDRIDEGRIAGVVRDPANGAAAAGLAVQAYRLPADTASSPPDPTVDAADYRTQSATDGTFELGYLRPGSYFVVALADRNRDGLAGAGESFAAPPRFAVVASDTGAVERVALFVTAADTTGPALRSARAVDAATVAVRFDEPVRLQPDAAAAFAIEDSLGGTVLGVDYAWRAADPREVWLAASGLEPRPYRLRLTRSDAVADSSGNVAPSATASFRSPSEPEIPSPEFVRFLPEGQIAPDSAFSLLPGERAGIRFTRPLAPAAASARLSVVDEAGVGVPYTLAEQDAVTLFVITEARAFRVQVDDTTTTRRYRVAAAEEFGTILGRVADSEGGTARVEVSLEGGARPLIRTAEADANGSFSVTDLPPGSYRIRVHLDIEGNDRWDGGGIAPYRAPEIMGWLPGPVRVRARWETDLGEVLLQDGAATAEGLDDAQQQGR